MIESQAIGTAARSASTSDRIGALVPLERSDLETYEAAVTRMAIDEAIVPDAERVAVAFRGRTLRLMPVDPARFNRAVAAHLCLN